MKVFSCYRFVSLWSAVLGLLLVLAGTAGGEDVARQKQDLKQIQERIEQLSKRLEGSRKEEGEVEKELKSLDRELGSLEKSAARLEKQLVRIDSDMKGKKAQAEELRVAISDREQAVRQRLRSIYRRGEMRLVKVLFEKGSPSQVAENLFFLSRLVRRDRQLLAGYRDDWRALRATLDELDAMRSDREQRLEVLASSKKTLDKGRNTRQSALRRLQKNRSELHDEIARLEEKARRLRQLLKSIESAPAPAYSGAAGAFGRLKGRLPWPGSGRLVMRFGNNFNPDLGTRHESQGIELAQDPGTSIHAVAAGTVVFAKPFRGFGNLIILDHSDGFYTLYAQARSMSRKVGDKVSAGDAIGVSGFGGGKRLYFEIRQRGTPLDPLQWLKPQH